MKNTLTLLTIAAAAFSTTAFAADDPWPKGWGGTRTKDYTFGVDATMLREGKPSGYIMSLTDSRSPKSAGTMVQAFAAGEFKGRRVRLRGLVKTEGVTGGRASLWLRADDAQRLPVQFDNMAERSLTSTVDWTTMSIVVDLPETAEVIHMGALLSGSGKVWVSGLSFEIVDSSVPVTADLEKTNRERREARQREAAPRPATQPEATAPREAPSQRATPVPREAVQKREFPRRPANLGFTEQ